MKIHKEEELKYVFNNHHVRLIETPPGPILGMASVQLLDTAPLNLCKNVPFFFEIFNFGRAFFNFLF